MTKRTFQIAVTKFLQVEVETDKLDAEFFADFQQSITHYDTVEQIAEHVAWGYVQGAEYFVEGVGDLKEMNIRVNEVDSYVELQSELAGFALHAEVIKDYSWI